MAVTWFNVPFNVGMLGIEGAVKTRVLVETNVPGGDVVYPTINFIYGSGATLNFDGGEGTLRLPTRIYANPATFEYKVTLEVQRKGGKPQNLGPYYLSAPAVDEGVHPLAEWPEISSAPATWMTTATMQLTAAGQSALASTTTARDQAITAKGQAADARDAAQVAKVAAETAAASATAVALGDAADVLASAIVNDGPVKTNLSATVATQVDPIKPDGGARAVGKGEAVFSARDYATPAAALSAAHAAVDTHGAAVLQFPTKGGEYVLSAALAVVKDNITIDFGRAKIRTTFAGSAVNVAHTLGARLSRVKVVGGTRVDLNNNAHTGVTFTKVDDPTVEDVFVENALGIAGAAVAFIDCNRPKTTHVGGSGLGMGVSCANSPSASILGGGFRNMKKDGVLLYSNSHGGTVSGVTVKGYNTIAEAGRGGIHIYGSNDCTVTGNVVDSGTVGGTVDSPKIRFRDARGYACTGNTVTGLGGGGIVAIVLSDLGTGAGEGTITGNTIKNVSAYGIQTAVGSTGVAADLYPTVISGNDIVGVRQSGANAGTGVSVVAGTKFVTIVGNMIEDTDGEGIATVCSAVIASNIIHNIGKGAGGSKAGIFVQGGVAVVAGNMVIDDQTVKTMTNSLRVLAGARVRDGGGNEFAGWTSAAVRNDGTIDTQVGAINTARVGFFGTAPVARPTGTPAAATDAATTQALVNDLRSKLLALGLIA